MAEKNETPININRRKTKKSKRKIFLAIGIPISLLIISFIVLIVNSMVSTTKILRVGDELFNKGEYALASEQYTIAV